MNRKSGLLPIFLIWLAICALLIVISWSQISTGIGWGPDDQLRQVQLRDWLAGQSWFDTTQYRIGAPDSQPMHWSRLIEIPLALIVLMLTPVVGAAIAETMAMVTVPLVALGLAIWLIFKITEQLFDRKVALLAAALTPTAVAIVTQLRPMRIDHHGWQIVLALLALWTMFWPEKRKSGIALGFALALWLSISLEGLPLSVAFIALLVWRWAVGLAQGTRLFWTLLAFVGTSIFLYLATQGGFDAAINYCDAVSPVHLLACLAAALFILPAIRLAPASIPIRLGALALSGAVALAVFHFTAPQCLGSAFGQIDPLVRDYWFVNVAEGLPVWVQPWDQTAILMGGSIITGLGAIFYLLWLRPNKPDLEKLFIIAYAFLWAFAVSLFVQRTASVAAAFALPLLAWAVHLMFVWARGIANPAKRILATVAVIFLVMPGPLAVSLHKAISGKQESDDIASDEDNPMCDSAESLVRLNALPRAIVAAPFNLGPKILVLTHHDVLATSHHRNDATMALQIRIFTSPPAQARAMLEDRNILYIAVCPEDAEMELYAKNHPEGLWGTLAAEEKPGWLQPVHLRDSGLLVWRVVPKP